MTLFIQSGTVALAQPDNNLLHLPENKNRDTARRFLIIMDERFLVTIENVHKFDVVFFTMEVGFFVVDIFF